MFSIITKRLAPGPISYYISEPFLADDLAAQYAAESTARALWLAGYKNVMWIGNGRFTQIDLQTDKSIISITVKEED